MAKTFLELINIVLQDSNEVPVSTGSGFANPRGIQAFVKEAINRSLMDIANASGQWEWLKTGVISTPQTVPTVDGTQWYEFKTIVGDDDPYLEVDFDTFFINDGADLEQHIEQISYDEWNDKFRSQDQQGNSEGVPLCVIRTDEKNVFGLSPVPDKVYTISFHSWNHATLLVAETDTLPFPDQYFNVLVARARYYLWNFKENMPQAGRANKDYVQGVNRMIERLTHVEAVRMRFL
jgi:hypothetical protein